MTDELNVPALQVLKCAQCHQYIGTEVMVERAVRLQIRAGVYVYSLHGECDRCGAAVHWDAPSVTFRRLMRFWERKRMVIQEGGR